MKTAARLLVFIYNIFLVHIFSAVDGKEFDKCSLAVEMDRLGVPRTELPDWVCLAQYESSFNTAKIHTNKNRSKDWGIFQINDRYWCKPTDGRQSANSCNISCDDLITDDITKAVQCARTIKKQRRGFTPWVAWVANCQTSKPVLDECFKP